MNTNLRCLKKIILQILFLIFIFHSVAADTIPVKGEYDDRIAELRLKLQTEPESYDALFNLARFLSFSGKREEAIELYTKILAKHPGDPDSLLGRGRVYTWMDNNEKAEADLLQVTQSHPAYADAWSALGDMYNWSDRFDKAAEAYSGWIKNKPEDSNAYLARAKAYKNARIFAKARQDYYIALDKGADKITVDGLLRNLDKTPEAAPWQASLSYSSTSFNSGSSRKDWHTYTFRLTRSFPNDAGSLALEIIRPERFDDYDHNIALDWYFDLWNRSYGNLRVQTVLDRSISPELDYRLEVFQGFSKGWEASINYRCLKFSSNTDIYGASIGKYAGDWYLRENITLVPKQNTQSISFSTLLRYYLKTADDYLEFTGGFGNSAEEAGAYIVHRKNHNYGIAYQRYINEKWGCGVSFGFNRQKESPDETSISVKVMRRL